MSRETLDLYQELAFGFRLAAAEGQACAAGEIATDPIGAVADEIASAMSRGAAVELSAGVDSRMILALGLWRGVRPAFAFTIDTGRGESDAARAVARAVGVRHLVLRPADPRGCDRFVDDAVSMVTASGWRASAVAVGWLPSLFAQLESERDEQISGVGGEAASGFYWSPLDRLRPWLSVARWMQLRLEIPGVPLSDAFGGGMERAMRARSAAELSEVVGHARSLGPWRDALDQLYIERRLENWAVPVLRASARHYRVTAPFMGSAYRAWARALPPAMRRGRRAQHECIRLRASELAEIPFGSAGMQAKPSRGARVLRRIARIWSRLARSRRTDSRFAQESAEALAASERVRTAVLALSDGVSAHPQVRRGFVESVMAAPRANAHAVGFLVTASVRAGLLAEH